MNHKNVKVDIRSQYSPLIVGGDVLLCGKPLPLHTQARRVCRRRGLMGFRTDREEGQQKWVRNVGSPAEVLLYPSVLFSFFLKILFICF